MSNKYLRKKKDQKEKSIQFNDKKKQDYLQRFQTKGGENVVD